MLIFKFLPINPVKLALFFIAFLSSSVAAHEFNTGKLEIDHPWARPTAAVVKTGAVYFSIKNPSAATDKLMSVDVSENVAQYAEIHKTEFSHDMAKMREAKEGLMIAAKSITTLSPGGTHIMLVGLTQPLELGATFLMTLHFKNSGAVTVEVWVEETPDTNAVQSAHKHH